MTQKTYSEICFSRMSPDELRAYDAEVLRIFVEKFGEKKVQKKLGLSRNQLRKRMERRR
jgi:hypothetical protein